MPPHTHMPQILNSQPSILNQLATFESWSGVLSELVERPFDEPPERKVSKAGAEVVFLAQSGSFELGTLHKRRNEEIQGRSL